MKGIIEHNAAEIQRLKEAIDNAVIHRSESKEAFDNWVKACDEFHHRFDALAFPGGLSHALESLGAGDTAKAEIAILYLELHPYFFRSQYIGTMLMRRLKKLPLQGELKDRFDAVLNATRERKLRSKQQRLS